MEENKVIEAEVVEVEEVKTESKPESFIKKHGKKIATVLAFVGTALLGIAIGKNMGSNTDHNDDVIEAVFSEVDSNE